VKRVIVFGLLCAGVWLHGMEEALLPGGVLTYDPACQVVSHNINLLHNKDAAENSGPENEFGDTAYHILPDHVFPGEEQKDKADGFVPAAMFSKKHKQLLSSFSPHMVSAVFLELETDADYKALKLAWESEAGQNNSASNALERTVAIKLFALLARKESRPSPDTYRKAVRCRRLGLVSFFLGSFVMIGGPLIIGLAHPHNCI
jgi:hypothetical protein